MKNNRLVVVLGMHRSGTSVVTRGLQVFNVSLGDRLLPPVQDDNPKGYWEDIELNSLNIEMLDAIDSNWHHVAPIESGDVETLRAKGYFQRAVKLLKQKTNNTPIFGYKDPRIAKLLPFWKEVFQLCQFDVIYVIAIRNPLSVVKSLSVRSDFDAERSYLLWLGHVIASLEGTKNERRVLVDFDCLISSPEHELLRIAEKTGLHILPAEMDVFKKEFLDKKLRHTVYDINDLASDNSCPPIVHEIYASLLGVMTDKVKLDDPELENKITHWSNEFTRLKSPLILLDKFLTRNEHATKTLINCHEDITSLKQVVAERDGDIASLKQVVAERDGDITSLKQVVAERDGDIASLKQVVAERDGDIASLQQVVAERDGDIASLQQVVAERDGDIASLKQVLAERDGNITSLQQVVAERDGNITSLKELVDDRERQITGLNRQQSVLNEELLLLNAERATFGSRIGRAITRLRARIAPVGTRRGAFVELMTKFATSLVLSGWKETIAKSYRYISFRIRSKLIQSWGIRDSVRTRVAEDIVDGTNSHSKNVRADHPQLAAWFEKNEPTPGQLSSQIIEISTYNYKPLISVIVPIYKVPQDVLDETLASLERQTYSNWQACIVWSDIDDSSGWKWLEDRCANDQRFKIKLLSENGGISRNSNLAFELVDGEYIALLDHDDTLTPWAFFDIVKRLQTSPELDFIYSDKDSISADGMMRMNALFKPEWSPEMLHSVNYLTHLNVIRTSLVREVGGWRPETDGAQDWDLFFRITERTKNIARVPSIHYHWRILETSTASGLAAKPYAALGQLKSQQDYFIRRGLAATVVPSPEGMYEVCWPVHAESTDIVIFQNGTLSQLVTTLDLLRAGKQESTRHIHVIHSTPATDALHAFKEVWQDHIFFTQIEIVNWRTALEAALSDNMAETILLLDGDATGLSRTIVEELSGWVAQHPDIAWASAIALNMDGSTVYEAGRVVSADHQSAPMFCGSPLFSFGWFGGPLWYRNARACSPYAVAISSVDARRALSKPGTFNGSRDNFVKFCLELSTSGQRGLIDPFARVHFSNSPEKNWPNDGVPFHVDPYFNPAFDQVNPLRLKS